MLIQTRCFGEMELEDDKILTFDRGIIGLENHKRFAILYDVENIDGKEGERSEVSWLQSLDESSLALPVVSPLFVKPDYNPRVEDELLRHIGELTEENLVILLTMTVPENIEDMTVNLMAPIIINADTKKGTQIVVENDDYPIKYNVYEIFAKNKEDK